MQGKALYKMGRRQGPAVGTVGSPDAGGFRHLLAHAQGQMLFYFDPPYRPLSHTSSFNDYAKQPFNDDAQIRLKEFCDQVAAA